MSVRRDGTNMKKYIRITGNPLYNELCRLNSMGVSLIVDDRKVTPHEGALSMLVAEPDCTYMRDYHYEGGEIKEIRFDRITIK